MKFVVAAGVLSQSFPALSQQATNLLGTRDGKRLKIRDFVQRAGIGEKRIYQTNARQRRTKRRMLVESWRGEKPHDFDRQDSTSSKDHPVSTDAGGAMMSPGSDLGGMRSLVGRLRNHGAGKHLAVGQNGPLRNDLDAQKREQSAVPCDPTSVDIGILACGTSEFCREDKNSELGGFCVNTDEVTSRQLFSVEQCNPYSRMLSNRCDCSALVEGTGTISCVYREEYVFCENVVSTLSSVYTFKENMETGYEVCYEFSSPEYQKVCVSYRDNGTNFSCSVEFNGESCNSCATVENKDFLLSSFNCSNVQGGGAGTADDLAELIPAIAICYDYDAFCDRCGSLSPIPTTNFDLSVEMPMGDYDGFTCKYFAYMYLNRTECAVIAPVAAPTCCGSRLPKNTTTADAPTKPAVPINSPTEAPSSKQEPVIPTTVAPTTVLGIPSMPNGGPNEPDSNTSDGGTRLPSRKVLTSVLGLVMMATSAVLVLTS